MGTLANSEDPDEMPPNIGPFHQDLQCLLRQNQSPEKEIYFFLEGGGGGIITCDPSIYTIDHTDLTLSNFMGNSIGTKRVNINKIAGL